jgi:hypothetical protein
MSVSRLHYIPLSTSYNEIYNIHAFFSGGTPDTLALVNSTAQHLSQRERTPLEGDMRLRRIARAGKHWRNTIGRQVDMEGELYNHFAMIDGADQSYPRYHDTQRMSFDYA